MSISSHRVIQDAHGFSEYDAIGYDSGQYVKALDSPSGVLPLGLAVGVGSNIFSLLLPGLYRIQGHGLTPGPLYVSDSTAGLLVGTKPDYPALGRVKVFVIDANMFIIFNTYGITSA